MKKKENTVTVMEVLMKAEAEQTSSISSGWKRELLRYNIRDDLPEKKHLFFWAKFAQISPPNIKGPKCIWRRTW